MTGWTNFKKYAIAHGVHNGPASIVALRNLYDEHKGSHYHTIVMLYKAVGTVMQQEQFEKEMGCAKCVKGQNKKMGGFEVVE
jgi:hypothetical protein